MSKVEIYYFSGTGNSLAIARDIARRMNGALIPIPSLIGKDHIESDADIMGIVFPVYFATNDNGGIPLIVVRFIDKLENIGTKYIFGICTHGGMPGTTIEHLKKRIEACGGRLAGGFTVKMTVSSSVAEKLKISISGKGSAARDDRLEKVKQQMLFDTLAMKLDIIQAYVNAKKEGTYETRGPAGKLLFSPLLLIIKPLFTRRYEQLAGTSHLPFDELIPLADRSFEYDEKCNGCSTCARVCPVGNIEMIDSRPKWLHHCENCLACYSWCPRGAICGGITAYNERHHHPDVELTDMLRPLSAVSKLRP